MKNTLKYLAILAFAFSARAAFGQTGFSETVTSFDANRSQNFGNDFWFATIQNYTDTGGSKYIRIYVSSLVSTTAYIQCGSFMKTGSVAAGGVTSFDLPLADELKSSGVAENKAIHVWSYGSDISVYLMSHNSYSGDGFYCIPTQDLGKDYLVAGYESFYEGDTSDFPSEFTITATQDSTVVDITPSTDLRSSIIYPTNGTTVAYAKGKIFAVTLDSGQAVQYQAVLASNADNFDVTGTIIHSNNPVGVVGGSMGSNIAPDFPFEDYLCDMIPPVQAWGETYYATSPEQTQPGHDYALYLMISTVPNQTIHRYDHTTGDHVEATLGPAYDYLYTEEELANKWYSNEPFLLVEYFNSATYPDGANGSGDPDEVVINPKENYINTAQFQAASSVGAQAPYVNYANLIVPVADEEKNTAKNLKGVLFDGGGISQCARQPIDDSFEIVIVPNVTAGAHIVRADSGYAVGVYLYGYGYDESYAWEGSLGTRYLNDTLSSDTVPPTISFVNDSLCLHILLSDTGSGIGEILADSASNLSLSLDSSFVPGAKQSFADVCVTDPLSTGYMHLVVADWSGNNSIATIIYTHSPIVSGPGFTITNPGFDTVLVGTEKTLPILTITDTSTQYPITIENIWDLAPEFIFDNGLAANKLPLTLSPLMSHDFVVTFNPGADSFYAAPFYATSSEVPEHFDTLTGIGYSIIASRVEEGSQTNAASPTMRATIAPNPAENSLDLDFSIPQTADVNFEISSIDGTNVFEWNGNAESAGEHIKTIDVSSLMPGSYLYRFESNGQVISGKLIINR